MTENKKEKMGRRIDVGATNIRSPTVFPEKDMNKGVLLIISRKNCDVVTIDLLNYCSA